MAATKITLEQREHYSRFSIIRGNSQIVPVLKAFKKIFICSDPAGNINADKEKFTKKIDGAISTIMGLDRAIRSGNDTGASVYDSLGLLFV